MKRYSDLTQAQFDDLLAWLSPDRDKAGESYIRIREGLIRYFRTKGCFESQSLADETINRVARKLKTMDTSGDLKTVTYFYGFAKNIFFEYLAEAKKAPMQLEPDLIKVREKFTYEENRELRFECLDDCMMKLKSGESSMVIAYFAKDRSEKFEARRRLAESLDISMGNLHIKIHRIKNTLRECLENCLDKL